MPSRPPAAGDARRRITEGMMKKSTRTRRSKGSRRAPPGDATSRTEEIAGSILSASRNDRRRAVPLGSGSRVGDLRSGHKTTSRNPYTQHSRPLPGARTTFPLQENDDTNDRVYKKTWQLQEIHGEHDLSSATCTTNSSTDGERGPPQDRSSMTATVHRGEPGYDRMPLRGSIECVSPNSSWGSEKKKKKKRFSPTVRIPGIKMSRTDDNVDSNQRQSSRHSPEVSKLLSDAAGIARALESDEVKRLGLNEQENNGNSKTAAWEKESEIARTDPDCDHDDDFSLDIHVYEYSENGDLKDSNNGGEDEIYDGSDDPDGQMERYRRYLRRLSASFNATSSVSPAPHDSTDRGGRETEGLVSKAHDEEGKQGGGSLTGTESRSDSFSDRFSLSTKARRRQLGRCLIYSVFVFIAFVALATLLSVFVRGNAAADDDSRADDSIEDHPLHPSVFALLSKVTPDLSLRKRDSPQRRSMKWLLDDSIFHKFLEVGGEGAANNPFEERVLERYGAATLYYATGGPEVVPPGGPAGGQSWTLMENWLSELPLCQWHGFVCKDLGEGVENVVVKAVRLEGNNLSGTIPDEIKLMKTLESINLSNNNVSGKLPAGLGELNNLTELHLGNNQISGGMDDNGWIEHLNERLEVLLLEDNQLSGPIPPSIGMLRSLYLLRLSGNSFTGEIPKEIGQLSRIYEVDLAHNTLGGMIPEELGLLIELRELKLGSNHLDGPIPNTLIALKELERVQLEENALEGPIPVWINSLEGLRTLHLDQNAFSGSVPDMGSLTNLEELSLESTLLTGRVPESLCDLNLRLLSANCLQLICPCCTQCFDGAVSGTDTTPAAIHALVHESSANEFDKSTQSYHTYEPVLALLSQFTSTGLLLEAQSPQGKAFQWLQGDGAFELYTIHGPEEARTAEHDGMPLTPLVLQKYGMATLYFATGGERSWVESSNWLSELGLCDWHGVKCVTYNGHKVITGINLADNNMQGSLPDEIQNFPDLEMLDLSGNRLVGAIPDGLGKIEKLGALSLEANDFVGSVPSSVCSLQLYHFSADCLGESAKVVCSCCTACFH